MHPEKATWIILNWLTLNAKDGYEVELRIRAPEEQMVYSSKIHMYSGTIFVQRMRKKARIDRQDPTSMGWLGQLSNANF